MNELMFNAGDKVRVTQAYLDDAWDHPDDIRLVGAIGTVRERDEDFDYIVDFEPGVVEDDWAYFTELELEAI